MNVTKEIFEIRSCIEILANVIEVDTCSGLSIRVPRCQKLQMTA